VCTGSMLLGFAGLLDGRHATTIEVLRLDARFVSIRDSRVRSACGRGRPGADSAGISAGIDMALKAVARYCGEPSPALRRSTWSTLSGQQRSPGLSMKITAIDHIVLTVTDMDRTVEFYCEPWMQKEVLAMAGRLRFGQQKINLHHAGHEFELKPKLPSRARRTLLGHSGAA